MLNICVCVCVCVCVCIYIYMYIYIVFFYYFTTVYTKVHIQKRIQLNKLSEIEHPHITSTQI